MILPTGIDDPATYLGWWTPIQVLYALRNRMRIALQETEFTAHGTASALVERFCRALESADVFIVAKDDAHIAFGAHNYNYRLHPFPHLSRSEIDIEAFGSSEARCRLRLDVTGLVWRNTILSTLMLVFILFAVAIGVEIVTHIRVPRIAVLLVSPIACGAGNLFLARTLARRQCGRLLSLLRSG